MTQPSANLYGAVDLSSLARPTGQPAAGGGAGPGEAGPAVPGQLVVEVTEATFADTVQRSTQVPVLVVLTSSRSAASAQTVEVLTEVAREYGGRFQLATVDADTETQIAAAFQVQAVPAVLAVLAGRPLPLFQGTYPAEQVRQVIDEVLRVAAESGVTGVLQVSDEEPEEPSEPPLPPLHAEALDAIDRGDLAAAEDAYTRALKENPGDRDAQAALLQVQLIRRVEEAGQDPDEVLAAAQAAGPGDVDPHLAAADVEAATGRFGAAFDRLLAVVRATAGDDREKARVRLVELFEIAGSTHPDVGPARRQLASALY